MANKDQAVLFIRARRIGPEERVATETQINAQRAAGNQLAQQLTAEITHEYVEHGGTGRISRRPVLKQMLAELQQLPHVRYVITYSGDRLARRVADFAEIEQQIEAAGAQLRYAAAR